MNKVLKILIIVIFIMVIILGTILLGIVKTQEKNLNTMIETEEKEEATGTKKIEKVTSRDDFYIVENCIQKYMKYLEQRDTEKVYGCLDEEYRNNKKITKDNIEKNMEKWKVGNFIAKEMYVYDIELMSEYFVKGQIENREYYIIVKVDYDNETFSVLPNYYIDENTIQNNDGIKIVEIKN